jgi:Protein of unknown function (DUF3499)
MPGAPYCARPGCGGGVAAWLTYAYDVRTVWLDDPDSDGDGSRLALCQAHADRLGVPRGWSRRDRRRTTRPVPAMARRFAPDEADGPASGPTAGPTPSALAV